MGISWTAARHLARRSAIALGVLGHVALAAPGDTAAPSPCVNRGVGDGARRTIHDATATSTGLAFCTGEDCWSLDVATSAVTAIPPIQPAPPALFRAGQGKSPDGRASATPTEVSFCPDDPATCKTFTYKFEFQPENGLYPMINAPGTLGAVVYAGVGEDGEPSYLLAYDLARGKLIKQVKLKASHAEVFRASFLFDNAFYSARLKKLGKLAIATADLDPIAGTDLVALSEAGGGDVILQNAATGKARARIRLGRGVAIDQKLSSPDGARLYVIAQAAYEAEVFVIDVARNKVVSHVVPAKCEAGTARVR